MDTFSFLKLICLSLYKHLDYRLEYEYVIFYFTNFSKFFLSCEKTGGDKFKDCPLNIVTLSVEN